MVLPRERPEAVLIPSDYAEAGLSQGQAIKERFGPVLACNIVFAANQGTTLFLRADPSEELLYPCDDPRYPAERYEWFVVQERPSAPPMGEVRRVATWTVSPWAVRYGYRIDPRTAPHLSV